MTGDLRPWLVLAGLGAFHGLNPAMGWLFAVALGMQQHRRVAVLRALLPIATGHALSIALVLGIVVSLGRALDPKTLAIAGALALFAIAAYRLVARHYVRGGMQVGFTDLTVWSFLMASAHGAGLMLVPVLLRMPLTGPHAEHLRAAGVAPSLHAAAAVVAVHTLAMLFVAGVVAMVVYEWVGVAFLRRGWVNFDLLWSLALAAAGIVLLTSAIR
jgi:hypothetical protein